MEFLVTMTTRVPEGTSDEQVAQVRAREAENSAGLARERRLLRLWRPPLGPGEWRSIGLFAAADAEDLERTLAGMPLRVWRTDEVTALAAHPNDPTAVSDDGRNVAEFLTAFHVAVPEGAAKADYERADTAEAESAATLAREGSLVRLWKLEPSATEPGVKQALGLWRAADSDELAAIMRSLPLDPWMTVETTPLTRHPSDPGHNAADKA
ncbi:muconolactone Delta-isomerase family protein [Actinospica robiniae]|uniref:muconolactone Delta-isomerase family protein n=1 Tax=Actinospica robiniae TaxID=304901 RepID=UPI000556DFC5|nr:muconolactone Delta-isomerase family protein [Actinospica robiniae]